MKLFGSRQPISIRAVIASVIIFAYVAGACLIGINRGMDHKIGWGPLADLWFLSVAISENVYGLKHGYVGFNEVFRALMDGFGIKGFDLNEAEIPRFQDAAVINWALERAASIPKLHLIGTKVPATLDTYRQLDLMSPVTEDLGMCDFYNFAFRLFGLKIQSAYYLYYLLLGLSIALFILQFYTNAIALSVLLINAIGFFLLFFVDLFSPLLPTVAFNRFGSTLCIIPGLHFMFLLLRSSPPSLFSVGLAVAQLTILLFGTFIRSSGNWMIMAVVFLLLVQFFVAIWSNDSRLSLTRIKTASRALCVWPIVLILCGVATLVVYKGTVPHPIYRTLENAPQHMRWHSAWLGLAVNPEFARFYPEQSGIADGNAFNMTLAHLRAVGRENEFVSSYTGHPRSGVHEAYIREQFLRFVREHPMHVLATFFYYKPRMFIAVMRENISTIDHRAAIPVLVGFVTLAMLGFGQKSAFAAAVRLGLPPILLLFAFSLTPILWAYPNRYVMGDQIWTTHVLVLTLVWLALLGVMQVGQLFYRSAKGREPFGTNLTGL